MTHSPADSSFHITGLPASRTVVTELIGRDTIPQVLIRVGLVPAIEEIPPPTPRRPLDHVYELRRGTSRAAHQ